MFDLFDSLDEMMGDSQWELGDAGVGFSNEQDPGVDPMELDLDSTDWSRDLFEPSDAVQSNLEHSSSFDGLLPSGLGIDPSSVPDVGGVDSTDGGVDEPWDRFQNTINGGSEGLLYPSDFGESGQVDSQNGCIVIGDVALDISAVDQQTHASCSLMAQEQFVERWIGHDIPEGELEELASGWGVYTPESGTTEAGWDMVLDHYGVPHQRHVAPDLTTLDNVISSGQDALIGVDARPFYDDPTVPPGSGHAVAIVGKGLDIETGEDRGYYITDSNYPGTTRLITATDLGECWNRDLISVNTVRVA